MKVNRMSQSWRRSLNDKRSPGGRERRRRGDGELFAPQKNQEKTRIYPNYHLKAADSES